MNTDWKDYAADLAREAADICQLRRAIDEAYRLLTPTTGTPGRAVPPRETVCEAWRVLGRVATNPLPEPRDVECPRCCGRGDIRDAEGRYGSISSWITCGLCGGTGRLPSKPTAAEHTKFRTGRWT